MLLIVVPTGATSSRMVATIGALIKATVSCLYSGGNKVGYQSMSEMDQMSAVSMYLVAQCRIQFYVIRLTGIMITESLASSQELDLQWTLMGLVILELTSWT